MTIHEFTAALRELGISQAEFGRHIGVGAGTVSRWKRDGDIPRIVELYVDLLLAVARAARIR